MIRKLTEADYDLVKDIVPAIRLFDFKETYLSGLAMWFALGMFKGEKLIGIVGAYYPREYPEWHFIEQYCDDENELKELLDEACNSFEKYGIYRFSWLLRDYDIDNLKNFMPERYITLLDYKTAAWSRPTYSGHFGTLFMNECLPVNSEVYCSVLKSEFRNK